MIGGMRITRGLGSPTGAVAALVVLTLGGAPQPASATTCMGRFELSEAIVEARVTSVRQTGWRVLFVGSNAWRGEAAVLRPVLAAPRMPRTFAFSGDDHVDWQCGGGSPRPRKGEVMVFGIDKENGYLLDAAGEARPNPAWRGRWISREWLTVAGYRKVFER